MHDVLFEQQPDIFEVNEFGFSDEVVKLAKKDWHATLKNIRKAKCRRSVPSHALPNEIWRILLCLFPRLSPEANHDMPNGSGIGFDLSPLNCVYFKKLVFACLCVVRATNIAPLQWHRSKCFSIPKKNPAEVQLAFDSQRSIHSLDPFGKGFYKHILDQSTPQHVSPNEHAYLKGRRREAAVKQQLIVSWRLKRNNFCHDTTSYDQKNAFGSVLFHVISSIYQFLMQPQDLILFKQRYMSATTEVPTIEGSSHFVIGSGPLPGDKIAAHIFRDVFHVACDKWIVNDKCPYLNLTCAITKKNVNVAKSIYADDLCDKAIYKVPPSIEQHTSSHEKRDRILNELTNPIGLHQHHGKKETTLTFRGTGAHNAYRALKIPRPTHRILDEMLYLGCWMSANGSNTTEIKARLSAAWKRWSCFSNVWRNEQIPFHVRRMFFRDYVYSSYINYI